MTSPAAGSSDAADHVRRVGGAGAKFLISDAHIQGDPAVVGTGTMSVAETWHPDADPAQLLIMDAEPDGPTTLTGSVDFNPQTFKTLHVQKDIFAEADGETSAAFLTFVDQTYSQIPDTGVPEPASLGVLALGGMTLLARRRKA